MLKRFWQRPEALLVATFVVLIAVGTVLLSLPAAHAGEQVGLLDAFFTATSAVCVTGLITVDTATGFTRFGQTVILVLIQLGGLGVMTFGALAARLLHLRLSFSSQAAWRGVFFEARRRANLGRALWGILVLTLVCEGAGMVLVRAGMDDVEARAGWYEAGFTAVSAFCNAGFSVYSDSLMSLRGSLLIMGPVAVLIIVGGLGYGVLLEVLERGWRWLRRRPAHPVCWSLQARMVLSFSLILTAGGAVALLVTGLTGAQSTVMEAAGHGLFQSITARTAGFNTIEVGLLPMPALLVLIALMFVGGSPGSCAGGVKTTTAAVWTARVWARLSDREDVSLMGRRIPRDIVRRAGLVLAVAGLWNLVGVLVLALTEQGHAEWGLEDLVFEQVSAFGTVGLSTGVTPTLSVAGKLWIIVTMFVGRLGPVTIAFAMLSRGRTLSRYPAERVMVG